MKRPRKNICRALSPWSPLRTGIDKELLGSMVGENSKSRVENNYPSELLTVNKC